MVKVGGRGDQVAYGLDRPRRLSVYSRRCADGPETESIEEHRPRSQVAARRPSGFETDAMRLGVVEDEVLEYMLEDPRSRIGFGLHGAEENTIHFDLD